MAFIDNTTLRSVVADLYKKASSTGMAAHQLSIIDRANARAQSDILRYLRDRGFTAGQVDAWRDQYQASKDLGIYYAILEIGILKRAYREQLDMHAKWIPDLDRGRDLGLLQMVQIVDGAGEPITPGAADAPIKNCVGQIAFDEVDSSGKSIHIFSRNMDF